MSDVVGARNKLKQIARELKKAGQKELAGRVEQIVDEDLYRKKAVRRAPVHSAKVTPDVKERILELAETTDMHESEIAAEVGVNPGRVSEVLHGDR